MKRCETDYGWYVFKDGDGEGWWCCESGLQGEWFRTEREAIERASELNEEEV